LENTPVGLIFDAEIVGWEQFENMNRQGKSGEP